MLSLLVLYFFFSTLLPKLFQFFFKVFTLFYLPACKVSVFFLLLLQIFNYEHFPLISLLFVSTKISIVFVSNKKSVSKTFIFCFNVFKSRLAFMFKFNWIINDFSVFYIHRYTLYTYMYKCRRKKVVACLF